MAVMSVDGQVYQVRVHWRLHGQDCYNVLSFISRGSLDLIADLLQPILTCIGTHLMPILSQDLTLVDADAKTIQGSTAQEVNVVAETDNVGETAVDSLPSTNAVVLALRTATVGRTGRGRMFLPGISESSQASSVVDATFIAAAVAFLACMFTAFHETDPLATPKFHWALHSRKDAQFYPIESYTVRPVIATMRSRKVSA